MNSWLGDGRDVWRGLRGRPGFSAVVVATLALGIGANAALFSLVSGVLLRPLPYPEADRVMTFWSTGPERTREPFSLPDFLDLRERAQSFESIGAYGGWNANLTEDGEPERLQGLWTTPGTLGLVGVRPALGRIPLPEEEAAGGDAVVVVGHGLWQRRFAGEASALGRTLTLNGARFRLVGVLPADFVLTGRDVDVIAPLIVENDNRRSQRGAGFLRVLGRLRPGVTPERARAEIEGITHDLRAAYPDTNAAKTGVTLTPLREELVGKVRPTILALQGAVALVLAIACANLAHLLLARAVTRGPEMALRSALGASRARLARLLVGEALALAALGGVLGLLLARETLTLILLWGPDLPRRSQVGIDLPVVFFALGLALLAGLASSLAPALRLARHEPQAALKAGGRSLATSGGAARGLMVAVEVGLSLVLLAGAGLLIKSVLRLEAVDPGFVPERLLTVRLSLPRARYGDRTALTTFHDRLEPRLRQIPGVLSVGAASVIPLMDWRASVDFSVEGRPPATAESAPSALYRMVSPGFREAMGIPLLRGRDLTLADTSSGAPVLMINRALASRFFADQDPVGAFLSIDDGGLPARKVEIVGVVGDVKHYGLDSPGSYDVYVPMGQVPEAVAIWLANNMSWVVRTSGDPLLLASAVKREVRAVDADVPSSGVRSMEQALDTSLAPRRFNLFVVEVFALAALLLAAIGTYAVTAQAVAQRTREVGVRIALGARPGQILTLVLGQGLRPVGLGLFLGLLTSFTVLRLASGLMFGVSPTDPPTLLAVTALLAAVAAVAISAPARRAMRVDPVVALRAE